MESIIKNNKNTTDLCNKLKLAQKQYRPLNKAEERALIDQYKDDRDKLNFLLFMHNIRIVFNVAKKYMSKTNDFDNLVMDGMRGLAEATQRFDINKNTKFITYATIWIRKFILMNFYGKQVNIDKNSISLNAIVSRFKNSNSGNNSNITYENVINQAIDPSCPLVKTVDDQISANDQSEICKDLMNYIDKDTSLSSTDKSVFIDMFQNGEKPKTLAEKYKITKNDVNIIKNKILDKMREILSEKYCVTSYADISLI